MLGAEMVHFFGQSAINMVEGGGAIGVGVEPSIKGVELLKEKYVEDKHLSFFSASAHSLPFDNDSFDLVTIFSVLHWIGRNEYLQALGELVRVTKKWLYVMDFCPAEDYRVTYHHRKGFFTYKMDFEKTLVGSGLLRPIAKKRWWVNPKTNEVMEIGEDALQPFLNNEINYHARKMVVFEKDFELLPLLAQSDFDSRKK